MTTPTTPARASGRGWAYLGALLGGAVSIAANIAHSYIPPTGARTTWAPEPGAVIGSVFWPIALFVAVEILTRVPWPTGRGWRVLRFGGLLPVALVAAVVSYRHLSGLLDHYGEDALTVTIGPLAVDGLMIMATGALLATALRTTPAITPEPVKESNPEPDTTISTPVNPVSPAPVAGPAADNPPTLTEPDPEPADDDHDQEQPVFAAWAQPIPVPPARVNGHQPAQVSA